MFDAHEALCKAKNLYKKYEYLLFAIAFLAIALLLRTSWMGFRSYDYEIFLAKWYDEIKALGGLRGFASEIGDYSPAYKYIITLITHLPINGLYAYKLVSFLFDILLAVFTGLTVRHILGENDLAGLMAYAVVLFLPGVFLNSAVWAQCDSIYTSFCITSFYFTLRGRGRIAMVFFGLAFAFKIQTVFYAPAVVIYLLKGKLKVTDLLFALLAYVLCALPAIIAGMNVWKALFGAYITQTQEYSKLTMEAPNLYQMISENYIYSEPFAKMMIFFSFGVCAIFCTYFYRTRFRMDDRMALLIAYLFSLLLPYILPHMHERYFYLSDIFAVIFVFAYPKKAYIAATTAYCSMRAVVKYLFDGAGTNISLMQIAFLLGAAIVVLCIFVYGQTRRNKLPLATEEQPEQQSLKQTEDQQ